MHRVAHQHRRALRSHRAPRWHRLAGKQALVSAQRQRCELKRRKSAKKLSHKIISLSDQNWSFNDLTSVTSQLCCLRRTAKLGVPARHSHGTSRFDPASLHLPHPRFRLFSLGAPSLRLLSYAVQSTRQFEGSHLQSKWHSAGFWFSQLMAPNDSSLITTRNPHSRSGTSRGRGSTPGRRKACPFRRSNDSAGRCSRRCFSFAIAAFHRTAICIAEMWFSRTAWQGGSINETLPSKLRVFESFNQYLIWNISIPLSA